MPERYVRAEESRPKLTDITGGAMEVHESVANPAELLKATVQNLKQCHFTFASDREVAIETMVDFEWTIHSAVATATEIARLGHQLTFNQLHALGNTLEKRPGGNWCSGLTWALGRRGLRDTEPAGPPIIEMHEISHAISISTASSATSHAAT